MKILCGDGQHAWAVDKVVRTSDTQWTFQCQAPDYFRDDRGDGEQGWVKSPWSSVSIKINTADATAELVFEGDHLDDGESGGRQVWQALVYRRGDEVLIMNYEEDDGIWFCRIVGD